MHNSNEPIVKPTIGHAPAAAGLYVATSDGLGQRVTEDKIKQALTTPKPLMQPSLPTPTAPSQPSYRPNLENVRTFQANLAEVPADATLAERVTSRIVNGLVRGEAVVDLTDLIPVLTGRGSNLEPVPALYRPPLPSPVMPVYKPPRVLRRLER